MGSTTKYGRLEMSPRGRDPRAAPAKQKTATKRRAKDGGGKRKRRRVQSPAKRQVSAEQLPSGRSLGSTTKYSSGGSLLETPPTSHRRLREEPPVRLTSSGGGEGVVDLNEVNVSQMEMVEGNDILQVLMRSSTPRAKRTFPSEEALTDSEKKDREVVRRRRMKLRSQYSAMTVTPVEDRLDEEALFAPPVRSVVMEEAVLQPAVVEEKAMPVVEIEDVDAPDAAQTNTERARLEEEEAETDEEPTESKIKRLSEAMHLNWRQCILWLVSGSLLLCALVVAAPFVVKMLEPPLPYCDSEWREQTEGTYVLTDPADFDRSKALQPFISSTAMASGSRKPSCQPCPVYGSCLNGAVISCAPPYELHYGLCVENPLVQEDLDQLALGIQQFVIDRAAKNACDNVSLWGYLAADKEGELPTDLTSSIQVLLSDVQAFVTHTISYGKAVTRLPREYVFNRALDVALRELKDIFVTEDQTQLVVGGGVVPWSCRAKHQLYSHVTLIALAVLLGTALVFAYRQFLLYRTERQLVDRFVKEVRFFLLDRTRHVQRAYPADHLRDNLLDKQYPRHHTWLRASVWPKVVAIVNGDSRVRSSLERVKGEDLVVWEWVSTSPRSRRPGSGRHVSRPRQATLYFTRPQQANQYGGGARQRKKPSRASLP